MKKRIAGLCMTLALVFGMSMGVYAADTPVATFDGSGQIKYNYDYKEDFGDAFEGMLPGDERTQQIILRNTSEKPTDFYMEVEVIKALEEASKASGAAYTFSLTVTQVGVNEGIPQVIYGGEGSGSAWIGGRGSENGLGDVNEVLEEYGSNGIKVANLDQGEEAVIALSVMLDGITGGNTYQGVDGTIQFAFHASYDTNAPETITETIRGEDQIIKETVKGEERVIVRDGGSPTDRVKTGDPAVILPLAAAMAVCAAVIVALLSRKRKQHEEESR